MKKQILILMLMLAPIISFAGCAKTCDPRQGGLFGFDEECWTRNMKRKKQILATLRKQNVRLREESSRLQEVLYETQEDTNRLKKILDVMNQDIRTIKKLIKNMECRTDKARAEQKRARNEIIRIQNQMRTLKNSSHLRIQAKKERIDELNRDVNALLQLIADF